MSLKKSLSQIKQELAFLQPYGVVLYGSYASGKATSRSDIDIAVITQKRGREENLKIWRSLLGKTVPPYDIKVFELLPLEIQISIADTCKVVFGNAGDIFEYFYRFRRAWKDVRPRFLENQFRSFKEKAALLRRARAAGF